jgi:NTE family protein
MLRRSRTRTSRSAQSLPLPDQVALVLQGGGALGAYQAGVYEALDTAGIDVDWIAGISIGAINAAVIAGNRPEDRVARLRALWETLSSEWAALAGHNGPSAYTHRFAAAYAAAAGVPGFFRPRPLTPFLATPGSPEAISWYDTTPLIKTLNELIDWDLLNDGPTRLSVGAVNVETGNFRYFDTARDRLDVRHIMASGALPPGFPPIEIDGAWYWDGGLVSNTPLTHVVTHQTTDMLLFQVDLFPARGDRPRDLSESYSREKDIRYSSRSRQVTDVLLKFRSEHALVRKMLASLPPSLLTQPDVIKVAEMVADPAVNIVHLIYRRQQWEGWARDFEFSRSGMEAHWQAGRGAIAETMRRDQLLAQNIIDGRTAAFDLTDKEGTPE